MVKIVVWVGHSGNFEHLGTGERAFGAVITGCKTCFRSQGFKQGIVELQYGQEIIGVKKNIQKIDEKELCWRGPLGGKSHGEKKTLGTRTLVGKKENFLLRTTFPM